MLSSVSGYGAVFCALLVQNLSFGGLVNILKMFDVFRLLHKKFDDVDNDDDFFFRKLIFPTIIFK